MCRPNGGDVMADVNIDMMLSDSTRSIGRRRREIEGLNQALERTRGLMASQASGGGGGEREGYDRARGAVGTGAAGRDFANQAQGLGGVVRLYATFAANIFAVGAAFQNLQQAANFERLIKASELMSERTGVNLKGLGKDLQAATGYAISFEDAMQFANLGTSAGIAAKQMTSLVEIAKGAAAGLGRDVNDSVRRIIQGTAKQEQEILDELGIFIKAKTAYEDYARKFQIEGGADALSAQQRVAAYADAVEKAGSKWKDFAKIDDPFSKFIATGKEALMEMLNFINKGVKPLLEFLSQSKDAIIALASVISLSLARRALPELKNLFSDLFTYNKARMQAQAQQQRMDIAREMATTSNLIQAEQAKLQAIQAAPAVSPAIIRSSFGQGTVSPGGRSGLPGISEQRLTSAIFGTRSNPIDLASYQKAEDLEKKINKAVRETIGSNQVKLDQLKSLGVVTQASTLQQIQLSSATIASSKKIFDAIQNQNTSLAQQEAVRAEILRLTNLQAVAQQRLTATTPGNVQATSRFTPVGPQPAPTGSASVIAASATAMGAAVSRVYDPIKTAYTKAVAEIGENTKQMNNVIGGGFIVNLKQAGLVLRDHTKILAGFGRELGAATAMMVTSRSATTAWAAAQVAGLSAVSLASAAGAAAFSTLGLALKGLMAALGPAMLLWAAWEMFLKDLVLSDATKASMKLNEEIKNLNETLKLSGNSLEFVNKQYDKGIDSSRQYLNIIETSNNAVRAQIDGFQKLLKAKQDYDDVLAGKAAKKAAEERGEIFSEEAFALEKIIQNAQRLGTIRDEELAELQRIVAAYKAVEAAKKSAGGTGRGSQMSQYQASETAKDRRFKLAEQAVPLLGAVEAAGQRRAAVAAEVSKAGQEVDEFISEYKKKLNKVPELGELVSTDVGKSAAKIMNSLNKAIKQGVDQQDQTGVRTAFNDLRNLFEKLAPTSEAAAQALTTVAIAMQEAGQEGKKLSFTELFKILQGAQPKVLKNIDENTKKYTNATEKAFSAAEAAINNYTLSIMKLDLELQKASRFNSLIEGVRGYSSELEIAAEKNLQRKKAEAEYNKEVAQAELEFAKVRDVRDKTGNYQAELSAASQKLGFAVAQAKATKDQKIYSAEVTAENKALESALKEIGFRYEAINRQLELQNARAEGTLRLEQERLRILREAGALSEPKLVEMETAQQGRQIQQQYEQSRTAAANTAQKEADEMNARYDLALLLAKTDEDRAKIIEAQGTALERLNQRERDAIALAGIRRDTDLQILKISSEAKKIYAELAEQEKQEAQRQQLEKTKFETQSQLLDLQKQELQYKLDIGLITQGAFDKEINGLDKVIRLREFNNKKLEIEAKYQQTLNKIKADEKVAPGIVEDAAGNIFATDFKEQYDKRREAARSARDSELSGLTDVFNKNEQLKDLYASLSTEQKGLASIYKDTFSAMSDSIVEFTKTGKLSFDDLINNMLASILKLYANQMFMSIFSNLLPGLPGMGSLGSSGAGVITAGGGLKAAKGMAFDSGVRKFAKGGMFTNSIVDQPTLFKFAKGTGLMGEAGPEAIMPLKRDSQGNLGVRAQGGGNVEVVVNNYGSEKAETRETVDSRGNRRIEVVVGDMTAGEVVRGGSSTNRAIRSTFGLQPQLIRR